MLSSLDFILLATITNTNNIKLNAVIPIHHIGGKPTDPKSDTINTDCTAIIGISANAILLIIYLLLANVDNADPNAANPMMVTDAVNNVSCVTGYVDCVIGFLPQGRVVIGTEKQ